MDKIENLSGIKLLRALVTNDDFKLFIIQLDTDFKKPIQSSVMDIMTWMNEIVYEQTRRYEIEFPCVVEQFKGKYYFNSTYKIHDDIKNQRKPYHSLVNFSKTNVAEIFINGFIIDSRKKLRFTLNDFIDCINENFEETYNILAAILDHNPIGCACQDCGRQFTIDFLLPDDLWKKITDKNLLCPIGHS